MLPILCRNDLTGVVTEVTEIDDLELFDKLEGSLRSTGALPHDIYRYEIAPLTYVTCRTAKYVSQNGTTVSVDVNDEYIRRTIYQVHQFLSDQIQGYISYSHDIQYFVGAIRTFSDKSEERKTQEERLEKINSLSNLMHAKASYFRYLTDNIDILEKVNISIFEKIESLATAIEGMSELYEKKVRTRIITPERPTLRTHDMFEFVPLAAIENAVKYGPKGGVAIAFNISEGDAEFLLEIGSLGPQLSSEDLPKIMTRSFRAAATKRMASGHGLGLYQADLGAKKLFGGKISFRQNSRTRVIDGINYVDTVVSIHIPKGSLV